jgi:hypothetical protein
MAGKHVAVVEGTRPPRRDPRFALHSRSDDPPEWRSDAKIAGRVEEVADPERIAAISGEGAPPGPPPLPR